MEDILGREIKDYDLVVAKGTGRDVIGMNVGIWLGKSIVSKSLNKRNCSDVYLIENPTEMELEIKNNIVEGLEKREQLKQEKINNSRKQKIISTKDLVIGNLYERDNGEKLYYFGKCKIRLYEIYYGSDKLIDEVEGYFYINEYEKTLENYFNTYNRRYAFRDMKNHTVKTKKRLVKSLNDNIELETEFIYDKEQFRGDSEKYKITIEYLDLKNDRGNRV